MKKDRLRNENEEIHNLSELIEVRNPGASHIAYDIDAFSYDIELSEDTDVEEALTFPHPKHKVSERIELMDTPHEENMDEDWADQDILPSDYSQGYNDGTTTDIRDDVDEIAEEEIHKLSYVSIGGTEQETPVDVMADVFSPDEQDSAEH